MEQDRFVRTTGRLLIVGSLVGVGIAVKEMLAPTPFGTVENVVMQGIVIAWSHQR
jgi:hypothetical protein